MQRIPMNDGRGARVVGQLTPFARQVVAEEGDVTGMWADLLAQYDTGGGHAALSYRREDHRIWVRLPVCGDGFGQPVCYQPEGLGRQRLRQLFLVWRHDGMVAGSNPRENS